MKYLLIALITPLFFNSFISQKTQIDNNTIWYNGVFYPENISGVNSMNDGEHFTSLDYNKETQALEINKYSYANYEKVGTILSSANFKPDGKKAITFDDYQFSSDETKLLLATEQESIYRHSSKSNYYIYDVASKKISALSDFSKGKQRLAEFSPNGNKVAFVRENNIFINDLSANKEVTVTIDGKMNEIINGGTDWVYEEEFAFHKGFYWAPDGSKIAYYKFDESKVKEFQMETYGTLYPDRFVFKYPKAGEDNSIISIHVYYVDAGKTFPFNIGTKTDIYIPRIQWTNNPNVLCVQRMNRLQNKIELLTTEFSNPNAKLSLAPAKVIYTETAKTYIDIHDNTTFLKDGENFLWTSEKDGFNHIYKINMNTGEEAQLTSGNWEVTSVYGMNEKSKSIYFQAAKEHPTKREVYYLSKKGAVTKLSTKSGNNRAEFSKGFKYYLHWNTDANTPVHVTLNSAKGKEIKVLEDNKSLIDTLKTFDISPKEFFTVKGENGDDLNAWMIKPSSFDKSKKYPMLMFVYGGPGINTVNDSWEYNNYFWWQSLAQQGYIVVSVDARGTGYRGRDFKHSTYLQLGKYETEDQIAAAKVLGNRPYIDSERIGIFGWSYGGYMSSLCITKGADVFKAAIAVAPVSNWRFYDNIYTERFMRTPQENGENYDINSPIDHVAKLKGSYLLIHGTADDNVHFQNAIEMVDALQKADKQFEFMAYPNKNHGIYGGKTRLNLYNKMTKFLLHNL